ncbi:MAG: nucleotidyltransferase domain-containing protein [Candidatus Heimdallarchaeota archaeon]|nr:nucleotidyltransferase domain-containing protein [Candidatus Heimdallarchaeota archaeon]
MTRKKIKTKADELEVHYYEEHWDTFHQKRELARDILQLLDPLQTPTVVYGSVARGDIHQGSDIDILLQDVISSYQIEYLITDSEIISRSIVMATPNHAIKGSIVLESDITISFPLMPFTSREIDFYSFGGSVTLKDIDARKRVPGINKQLLLIMPIENGHTERSILNVPQLELTRLGFSPQIIEERKRVLKRRDDIGRTGVFLNDPVDPELGFEATLRQLMDRNHLIRKKVRR